MARHRRRLRFRVMAAFALSGLAISASLSVLTYVLARSYLLNQRQSSAVRQARANAQLVRALLRSPQPDVARLLSSLESPATSQSVVLHAGQWFGTSAVAGPDALPSGLRHMVSDERRPARQRYHQAGRQVVTVGIPLSGSDDYFEVFPLTELTATLRTLRASLAAGSLLGFVVSLAVGAWATRRVLRPVRDIGRAAGAIASGRLEARLDAEGDHELVELATGFNAMVDSLQARIVRDARFASDVSHELRSPLTTLHSAVEIMQHRRSELGARTGRALDLLAEEVKRFETLVEDLLEISRYDAGVAHLELEPVDVTALVNGLLTEAGQVTRQRVDPETTIILADRRRLEQALRNVIGNAIAHAGGVASTSVVVGPEWTEVAIEDRGPGVADDERGAIFERFARGARARRSSGSGVGLGLALVAEHLRLQGGDVRIEDIRPCGARFVLRLPTREP